MNVGNPVLALKLYNELASWFPLLTPPEDYAGEADVYRRIIEKNVGQERPRTLLELGCGGGHNAFYLKEHFRMTLTDIAPAMLDLSRRLNPACEHLPGERGCGSSSSSIAASSAISAARPSGP